MRTERTWRSPQNRGIEGPRGVGRRGWSERLHNATLLNPKLFAPIATAAAKHCARASSNFATRIYGMLGTGCWELGQYDKAITLHKEGDRSDGGRSGETGVDVGSARGLLHWATEVCQGN